MSTSSRIGQGTVEELTSDDPRRIGQVKSYELLARLGNGGMGRVYLGKSPLAEKVAIKVILPQWLTDETVRRRFEAEVQSLKLAQGIRVAQYIDSEINDRQPWLAVKYVPGRSLLQHVEDRGALPARLVAALGAMLAEGLATIHGAGLLHRDLKPANVMLGEDGPCIIDLGLAVLQERDSHLTHTGFAVGTAAYMSPEQALGDQNLTGAVDVYALGATLLFAATGHNAYPRMNPVALAKRITDQNDHPDLSGLPKELHSIVGAMLAFDKQSRPSVAEAMTDLAGIATSEGVHFETVRVELTRSTYVAPPAIPQPPLDLDDPVTDDEWSLNSAELFPNPPELSRSTAVESTGDLTREPASSAVDLSWLAERLRQQYARRATL